jgi:hypothetical protein
MYIVNENKFSTLFKAIAAADATNSVVILNDGSANAGRIVWRPAPKVARKPVVRHFLVNADGTQTEFGKVRN